VVLYYSCYSPFHNYFRLLSCLEKVKYSVYPVPCRNTVSPHCGGGPGTYVDPTLKDKKGNLYEGEVKIYSFIKQRADSLGIDLEAKVEQQ